MKKRDEEIKRKLGKEEERQRDMNNWRLTGGQNERTKEMD